MMMTQMGAFLTRESDTQIQSYLKKRKKERKKFLSDFDGREEDMATEIKANVMKMKPNEDGSSSKGKAIVTKSSKQVIIDSNQKSNVTVTKSEAKEKSMASSSKIVSTTTAVKVKSQRKVYTLPGQKHDPPEEREPLRIFYESLLNQIPSSQMAEFWMMEHGLLSPERAKRAYERKQKSKQQIKITPQITNRAENSQKQQASKNGDMHVKKRTINGSDDDADNFIVKRKKGTR